MSDEQLFAQALRTLGNGSALSPEELGALSHLTTDEVAALRPVWEGLSTEARGRALAQLHQSERESPRQDFNAVYQIGFEDADPAVRRQAVESVVEDAGGQALDTLARLANKDLDPTVREATARALGPFALKAELEELPAAAARAIEGALLSVLRRNGEAIGARREALASLGYLDNQHVAEEIRRGYGDPELRQSAVRAMGRSANIAWLETLVREAAGDDAAMREEAARALGEMADRRGVETLTDMVDDPVIAVRLAAIAAVGQVGGDEARDALIYALEDKRRVIREAAEAALADVEFDEDPLAL